MVYQRHLSRVRKRQRAQRLQRMVYRARRAARTNLGTCWRSSDGVSRRLLKSSIRVQVSLHTTRLMTLTMAAKRPTLTASRMHQARRNSRAKSPRKVPSRRRVAIAASNGASSYFRSRAFLSCSKHWWNSLARRSILSWHLAAHPRASYTV